MYKLLLVDDESTMRKRIIDAIDWQACGFEIVADAENGVDALEYVETYRPDVVLTDIKMPYMDGIALSKAIVKRFPLTKIIILTGFEDFKYAKEAINLKVLDYILKPVTKENLIKVLEQTRATLDKEIKENKDVMRLRKFYEQSLPIMKNKVMQQLVRGKISAHEIKEVLAYYQINFKAKHYQVCILSPREQVGVEAYKKLEFNISLTGETVKNMVDDKKLGFSFAISEYIAVVFYDNCTDEDARIDTEFALYEISCYVEKYLNFHLKIALGNICHSLTDVAQSYRDARNALDYAASTQENEIIYFADMVVGDKASVVDLTFDKQRIIRGIKTGDVSEVHQEIKTLFKHIADVNGKMTDFYFVVLELVMLTRKTALEINVDIGEAFDEQNFLGYIRDNAAAKDIEEKLLDMTALIVRNVVDERASNNSRIIKTVKEYVGNNYHDPDIKVDTVCNLVFISPNYFSAIFKKTTKQTFTNYLTDMRLERAKELLKITDLKSFEVSDKVGFTDPNYFSYCFKKNVGVSPMQYRKS